MADDKKTTTPVNTTSSAPLATAGTQTTGNAPQLGKDKKGRKFYKLTAGKHVYTNDEDEVVTAKPGDKVPLTEAQAKAFGDKFEVVLPEAAEEPEAPPVIL